MLNEAAVVVVRPVLALPLRICDSCDVIPPPDRSVFIGRDSSPSARHARIELAVFQPELAIADAQGEKILEVLETDEGLVCWLRGQKYTLNPATDGKR